MTEPVFKAPLPPQEGGFTAPSTPTPTPGPEEHKEATDQNIKEKILPYLWYVLGGSFAVGLIFGMMMSGDSSSAPSPQQRCRLTAVQNPDIKGRFDLCGRAPATEPCIMYIMNKYHEDRKAEDFFDEVRKLTERSRQLISMENPTYSQTLIPPGAFVEIKVPSLR